MRCPTTKIVPRSSNIITVVVVVAVVFIYTLKDRNIRKNSIKY